ncbi:peptidoglycan DD-metalloendopeptidase family protein [Clostridium perfringens]|uniref:phage tail spike protein n=1 Tax=Clostridium perfringens TaxID=1502 RepID=UPI0039E8CDF7|nr:peptidoglycan DD-metalloendopeptidase family protein [Clostridium perfringens]EHR1332508.1 peptidoglycan DD-metalloendopeptidase family protein [Clostridium perfringens]EHR1426088.1 peptidoglycan DD-metalloendopeptidase family protein [Clostridium perfringens]
MSIEYYSGDNNNYEFDGDVTLKPNKATFKISLNGICEIEIDHPYDKEGRWKLINGNGVIKAPTPYSEGQLFPIYNIDKTMLTTGLKIKARHIFFDLYYSTTEDIRAVNCNCQRALNILLADTKFNGYSDIKKINTCYFVKQNRIEAINGSNRDNSIINRWGGEIFLDNFDVYVNERIGEDKGLEILYGTNMVDLGLKENRKDIVTRIKPVAFNGRRLPELFIDSPLINKYRIIYEKYIEFNNLKFKGDLQNETEENDDGSIVFETEEELYNALREECRKLFEGGLDKPTITGNVKVAALSNTEKYKYIKNLVNIELGDTLIANHTDLGVNIRVRCVGYEWDILKEKYINVSIGEVVKNYFQNQSDTTQKVNAILNKNGSVKSEELSGIIHATKAQFQAMRDASQPQHVLAMLFEDRIKGSKTYGACAIGSMGLMIASKRLPDDSDWDWNTFIGGGFAMADWLIGKLKTVLIQNMDASFEIDLNKPGGALFRNNGKDAILIENNMIKLFNWKKNGDFIGGLMALIKGDDENKPLIGLSNDIDSALALGYAKKDSISVPSYIEFDKYNILEDSCGKPVRIYEEVDFKGNKVYNIDIRSDNGKNNIMVGDHYINLTTENNEIVISDRGVRIGKKNTFYYDANSGDITLNGVIKNSNGQVILDPNNAGIGGGGIDNIGNVSKGIPSRKYFRYVKGIEGLQQYPGNIGDGQITYGYGVTQANEPTYFAKLGPAPCSEETASKVLFELIPDRYGSLVKNQMLKDGLDISKVPINVFDAFVDLCYNTGYYNSRMYRAWKDGASLDSIYNDWLTYATMPGTIFQDGLERRRKEEAEMFKNANYIMSPISILNAHGGQIGTVKGDGYFPSFTGNFKTVNNAYGNGWIIPVTGGQVTALFGHYPSGAPHSGTDFGVPEGTPVRASKSGTVIKKAELDYSYGYHLFIDHGDGLVTIYAHNSELLVNQGDTVRAGQVIAKSGSTGNSSGPHSHIELRYNGTPVNFAPSLRIGDVV